MTIDELIEIARTAYEARGLTATGDGDTLWPFIETELREGCQGYPEVEFVDRAVDLMQETVADVQAVLHAFEREQT